MNRIMIARTCALIGYFGLFVLLMVWIIWFRPIDSPHLPASLSLLLQVGPLMFPLRGMLHGRAYTHAWVSFLALFYLFLGITEAWTGSNQPLLPALEIVFSTLLYLGGMFYARFRGKQLKESDQGNSAN